MNNRERFIKVKLLRTQAARRRCIKPTLLLYGFAQKETVMVFALLELARPSNQPRLALAATVLFSFFTSYLA